MFNLIQKIIISKVVANMCMCVILPLLRLVINIANIIVDILKIRKKYIRDVPVGGTSAEDTGGSIRTSRHSVLLEVVDHSRCRNWFAVQSREHPPRRKRFDP